MELKEGDLVVTLPKVESIRAGSKELKEGLIGVVSGLSPNFNDVRVYEVTIEGQTYYLFEDEIERMEEKC